jgi:maleate isomerase
MPDRYGPRGVFAIVAPLQNANMQPEFEMLRPDGISNQIYRFDISNHVNLISNLEDTLGRTVVSTNAASYWYALRKQGIKDRIEGYGRLLMQTVIG